MSPVSVRKVTFLEPPPGPGRVAERFAGCSYELYHFPDLSNLYAFTVLAHKGVEVSYLDARLEEMDEGRFWDWIDRDESSHYVIHSVILSKPLDLGVIRRLLERKPSARILLHGPEPTRVPQEYLLDERILVFRGDVEPVLAGFLLEGREEGISRLREGQIVHHPAGQEWTFDELPIPSRDHPDLKPYLYRYHNPKFRESPFTVMLASRGCSFRCNYCVPIALSFAREMEAGREKRSKPGVKMASAERVVAEFRELHRLGFRAVMVADDQFLWGKARTLQICEGIRDLGLEWGCLSRADFLGDEEVVRALAGAGCVSIDIGAESFSQKVLDAIDKDLKVEDIERAVPLLRKYGIEPKLNIMFGTCPEETEEDIRHTVSRLKELGVRRVMFTIATPFKGTPFYDRAKREGWLVDDTDSIDPMGKAVIAYPGGLSRDRLEELCRGAYRSFYLRPGVAWDRLRSARSFSDIARDTALAWKVLTH
jgi:radical SAM superfamily enzyme YgiQ (UPF0313 family)